MTREEKIKSLSTWDFAQFIYDVSSNAVKITNCTNDCIKCVHNDAWCVSEIAEYFMEGVNE